MMFRLSIFALAISLATFFGLAGCGKPASESAGASAEAHADDEHGHAEEGPHGGHLIELGNEEYHAELTHDDATHSVAIYVLDGMATNPVAIDAQEVSINLVSNGAPMQFKLPAAPQSADPPGQTSRFEIVSETLCDAWDAPNTTGRLNVTIGSKPYVGAIEAHEHEEHEDH